MGITRLANVTGLDRLGLPVVNAFRPNSRSLSVSQGKGLTLAAAKASAAMEAIEGFHAENVDLPLKEGSYNQLVSSDRVVDVDGLARLHATSFDRDRPIWWIAGFDLNSREFVWLPYETVHTDYTLPKRDDAGCFVASTNGLASGNQPCEAIVHAICEVIERDANSLWDLTPNAQKAASRIEPDSVADAACRTVIEDLQNADMAVGIWDMTSDVGVPSFYCLIVDDQFESGHSGGGAGSHPEAGIALLRALTEAVQVRTNYITGARDDLERDEYEPAGVAQKIRHARRLLDTPASASFLDVQSRQFATFEEDLDWLLSRLIDVGIEQVISVDLTKSAFQIPVVRIVIPGLEGPHDHADYSPGPRARELMKRLAP